TLNVYVEGAVPLLLLPLPLQATWTTSAASSTPASAAASSSFETLYDDCPVLVIYLSLSSRIVYPRLHSFQPAKGKVPAGWFFPTSAGLCLAFYCGKFWQAARLKV